MIGKNNIQGRCPKEKVYRYAIRKLSVGAASVTIAAFCIFGNGLVSAEEVTEPAVVTVKVDTTVLADALKRLEADEPTDEVLQVITEAKTLLAEKDLTQAQVDAMLTRVMDRLIDGNVTEPIDEEPVIAENISEIKMEIPTTTGEKDDTTDIQKAPPSQQRTKLH